MRPRITLALVILIAGYSFSYGQDSHYWTQQYGTKSMLLSGSAIGGVDDLGAVFYNPGRLAIIANSAFLLSASVYESTTITVSDAFGAGKSARNSTIKGVPTLAAGTFKIKWLPKHHFAYSILTRQSADMSFSFRGEKTGDLVGGLPGNEIFGAEASFRQNANEQWIGLTCSYPISSKVSVGATMNYSNNNQSRGTIIAMQAMSIQDSSVHTYRYNRAYSYKQSSLLWKLGLALDLGKWQLGLTVTTPMLKLSGSGSYTYEEFYSNVPGFTKKDGYASSYQSGLNSHYQSPFSVGAGASRKIGKNTLHLSAEWFNAVPKYMIMEANPHISQSTGDTIKFQLTDQIKSVMNAGIGAEFYVNERISGFASFSTDFSTATDDVTRFAARKDEAGNSSWNMNFYHVGAGIMLKLKGADMTLGATHTGASQQVPRPLNFPGDSSQPIFDPNALADFEWERWRFVFSFSLPFLKNYTDRLTGEQKK